jgi:hypothetical protein
MIPPERARYPLRTDDVTARSESHRDKLLQVLVFWQVLSSKLYSVNKEVEFIS